MKRHILLFLGVLLCFGSVMADRKSPDKGPNPKMWKEIQDFKMKFLAQEMNLDREQRVKFYETYSELSEKKKNLFCEIRRIEKQLEENKNATDEEYAAASARIVEAKEKDAALDKEYDARFAKFLSSKQIYQMKNGEEKFKRKMAEMRDRKGNMKKHPKKQK